MKEKETLFPPTAPGPPGDHGLLPPQGEEGVHLDEERTIVVRLHLPREVPGSKSESCTGYLPDWAFAYLDNILRLTVNLSVVSWLGQVDCSKASLAKRLPQGPLTTPNSQVFFGGQYFLVKLVSASKLSRRNLPVIFDNSWRWQRGR